MIEDSPPVSSPGLISIPDTLPASFREVLRRTQDIGARIQFSDIDSFTSSNPIFSICIVAYDANILYFEQSIRSVLSQSYRNVELVLISNGSTGHVRDLVLEVSADARVTLIDIPENTFLTYGVFEDAYIGLRPLYALTDLWNLALLCARGEYFYALSWDDLIGDGYCQEVVDVFQISSSIAAVAPSILTFSGSCASSATRLNVRMPSLESGVSLLKAKIGCRDNRYELCIPGDWLVGRTSSMIEAGGFDDLWDITQISKLAIMGDVGFAPKASLFWRYHNQQLNKKMAGKGLMAYAIFKKHLSDQKYFNRLKDYSGNVAARKYRKYIYGRSIHSARVSCCRQFMLGKSFGLRYLREMYFVSDRIFFIEVAARLMLDLANYLPRALKSSCTAVGKK